MGYMVSITPAAFGNMSFSGINFCWVNLEVKKVNLTLEKKNSALMQFSAQLVPRDR